MAIHSTRPVIFTNSPTTAARRPALRVVGSSPGAPITPLGILNAFQPNPQTGGISYPKLRAPKATSTLWTYETVTGTNKKHEGLWTIAEALIQGALQLYGVSNSRVNIPGTNDEWCVEIIWNEETAANKQRSPQEIIFRSLTTEETNSDRVIKIIPGDERSLLMEIGWESRDNSFFQSVSVFSDDTIRTEFYRFNLGKKYLSNVRDSDPPLRNHNLGNVYANMIVGQQFQTIDRDTILCRINDESDPIALNYEKVKAAETFQIFDDPTERDEVTDETDCEEVPYNFLVVGDNKADTLTIELVNRTDNKPMLPLSKGFRGRLYNPLMRMTSWDPEVE